MLTPLGAPLFLFGAAAVTIVGGSVHDAESTKKSCILLAKTAGYYLYSSYQLCGVSLEVIWNTMRTSFREIMFYHTDRL